MLRSPVDRCFLLTGAGTSALSTVRLAGPGVVKFLERRFSRAAHHGRPVHGELRDDDGVIDDPVVVLRSDGFAVDLTLHGGSWIARCVTTLAQRDGFVLSPVDVETIGSTDAVTIFEHELFVSLPNARTELATRMLLAQPEAWNHLGATDEYPHPCPARCESWSVLAPEFPTGGGPALTLNGTDESTHPWHQILEDRSLEHLLHPPTLAIVGEPNAGKSTLANRLFGQQRSIVSAVAGTTRDWVGEAADLEGLIVKLIDTPGFRASEDPIEQQAIEQSRGVIERADLTLLLLDATRPIDEQRYLLERHPEAMVVLNKIDCRAHAADADVRTAALQISAERGDGVGELIRRIHQHFGIGDRPLAAARIWTARQREDVARRLRGIAAQ